MVRLRTIGRRAFLIGSVAVAGGVAFGTYVARRPHDNPLLDDLAEGEAAITPYVLITASGITLITPRADMGQGSYSIQAVLIAEELDVNLDQVAVTPGQPAPAYYNTALAGDAVPFAFYDNGTVARTVRAAADTVMKVAGLQITGVQQPSPTVTRNCAAQARSHGKR